MPSGGSSKWFIVPWRDRLGRTGRHPRESVGNEQLRDALAHIARCLRSSDTLSVALLSSTTRHPTDVTRRLARMTASGVPLGEACLRALDHESDRDVVMSLHVLSISASSGGDIAKTIDSLIDTLDDRACARAERRTQAATAMASTRLITWLPVVCGGYLLLDDHELRRTMIATPLGWTCLGLGVALNIAGRRWARILVERP